MKNKDFNFTNPIKADHLATVLVSELKLIYKTMLFKRKIYDKQKESETGF